MGTQSSAGKRGTRSAGEQTRTANRGGKPPSRTAPVAGAYGREGLDRDTEGKLRTPSRPGRRRRRKAA